jgi:nucleotide-binding universal stress UspA family protein
VPRARIQKILVPLDGSPGSESVLWTVAQLARAQGARVRLIRVAREVGAVMGDDDRVLACANQESERVEVAERAKLRRAADKLEGIRVETAVRFGDPASRILDEAEEIGADLIALATHHRSGLARVLKGSVAERVERGTSVPVVLVPYGESEAALS